MKTLKLLLVGTIVLTAFAGCEKDAEEPVEQKQDNSENIDDNQSSDNNEDSGDNKNSDDDQNTDDSQGTKYNEAYYAANASISSSDSKFTATDDGGTISFKVSGGEVVVDVDCGIEWIAQNSAEEHFDCTVQPASITVCAERNLEERELNGIITLMTAESQIKFASITVTQDAYGDSGITVETNEWHAPAVGENRTTTIKVEATEEWTVECEEKWLTIEKTQTAITLTVAENTDTAERVAEVVLICTGEDSSGFEVISVTQDGLAYITLSEEELILSSFGSTVSVTVESNFDWECTCDVEWATVAKSDNGDSFTISYTTNGTEADREGKVTITAGDGAANVAEAELKLTQSWENLDALILEYTITDNYATIYLPIYNVSNVTIDWDDGTTTTTSYNNPSHYYVTPGIYTVTINGTVERLRSYSSSSYAITGAEYLTAVKQWGNTGLTSMEYAFYRCSNLTSLPDGAGPFSNVTTFYEAFYYCEALKDLPEGIFGNCAAVTTFNYAFYYCSSLTDAPSFAGCSAVTTFNHMFEGCTSLTNIPKDIFSECSSASNFQYTFYGCKELAVVPENMFSECSATYYTYFDYCFYNCSSLVSAPSFEGHTAAGSFYYTFRGCSSLTTVPEKMFAGCSRAGSFYGTFYGCSLLTSVPENIFSDCSAVTDFRYVFYNCTSLKTVPVNIFDDSFLVVYFNYAFYGCSSVEGESPYTEIETDEGKAKVHIYERSNYAVNMRWADPTGYSYCFTNSTFSDINSIPSGWGGKGN